MSEVIEKKGSIRRRTKGEKTRKQILDAAITVLAQQGIKGTTHRAVAAVANIQLSLTTYYFKDINELVHEAFLLSAKETQARVNSAWDQAFEVVEAIEKAQLRKKAVREQLCNTLADMSAQYIYHKLEEEQEALAVEQLMFTQAKLIPELREIALQHKQALITPFMKLCGYFNKKYADIDADIMLTIYTQLEYRNLGIPVELLDIEEIRTTTYRILALLMGVRT
ncbi:TetR/AcrR family transcriptional regulator [Thalassotalea agarivorans]|uniref:Transcriptional regulator, TetR family n=1 Tax=Thalassotalea agarivorans TaxID=349064 RepID=A0A1I0FI45_THASX|nr:TetR family transcriptional regulator [Thalassotalea agarivorans]SET57912.1 transcriptional regulator, TetR family [Thalassotalea agarivorans]